MYIYIIKLKFFEENYLILNKEKVTKFFRKISFPTIFYCHCFSR